MRIVTGQEIIDWVKPMPDDQVVTSPNHERMQSRWCIFTTYARQVLGMSNAVTCGSGIYLLSAPMEQIATNDRLLAQIVDAFDLKFKGFSLDQVTAGELRAALPQYFGKA